MDGDTAVATVTPEWAGRVAPGLDQINVRIPESLPDGTYGIQMYFPPPVDMSSLWYYYCPMQGPCGWTGAVIPVARQ